MSVEEKNEQNEQNTKKQSNKKEPRWKTESIWHDPATPYYRTTSSGMMFGVKVRPLCTALRLLPVQMRSWRSM